MKYIPAKQKGFTILELIISITIFSMMIFVTIALFSNVFLDSKQQFLALDNTDNARSVTSRFVNEVRNAQIGVDGSYQINTASNNQLIFYSRAASVGATVNRINYYITGTTLYKGITISTGNPQVYNLANEAVTIIQKDVVNGSAPLFTYYDGNYNGVNGALTQPINVNTIKYIKINLTVLNQVKSQSTAQFNISAGANIRNLKNNLGN